MRGILELPVDLLETIFLTSVYDAEISPVLLTHVCRHWRDVAHSSARLWTEIDLASPEKARHFFELSQGAHLQVVWFNRSYGVISTAHRDWIWQHAGRFAEVDLISPSKILAHIVSQMGQELPRLSSLTFIADDLSLALRVPIELSMSMPRLRSLILS